MSGDWSTGDEGDDGEDQDEFDEVEEKANEVFCEEDVADCGRRDEVEAGRRAVHAEAVVGEDGDAEEGVSDGGRERQGTEACRCAHAVGEEEDHEDGSEKAVELVGVAAEVDELLCGDRRRGWG